MNGIKRCSVPLVIAPSIAVRSAKFAVLVFKKLSLKNFRPFFCLFVPASSSCLISVRVVVITFPLFDWRTHIGQSSVGQCRQRNARIDLGVEPLNSLSKSAFLNLSRVPHRTMPNKKKNAYTFYVEERSRGTGRHYSQSFSTFSRDWEVMIFKQVNQSTIHLVCQFIVTPSINQSLSCSNDALCCRIRDNLFRVIFFCLFNCN